MAAVKNDWKHVWSAIDDRRTQLGMSLADLYRASGVSETTFIKMRKDGVPVARADNQQAICRALRWTAPSINLLLSGSTPITWEEERAKAEAFLAKIVTDDSFTIDGMDHDESLAWQLARVSEMRSRDGHPPGSVDHVIPLNQSAPSNLITISAEEHARMLGLEQRVNELTEALVAIADTLGIRVAHQDGRLIIVRDNEVINAQFATAAADGTVTPPPKTNRRRRPSPLPEDGDHLDD